jgi:hypothetical protein
MNRATRGAAAVLGAAGLLLLAACGSGSSASSDQAYPAVVEPIDGTDLSTITITQQAAQRLDLKTTAVKAGSGGSTVPYSAVLYGPDGTTWVYMSPEPLNFVRAPIVIKTINGNTVVLSKGPAVGTQVASLGVTELFGAESGLGQ